MFNKNTIQWGNLNPLLISYPNMPEVSCLNWFDFVSMCTCSNESARKSC